MFKKFVILCLEFIAALAGSLIAGWLQQGLLFTSTMWAGTISGATLMFILIAWLENENSVNWSWRWHGIWYLREILHDEELNHWKKDFASISVVKKRRQISATEVVTNGERQDLVTALHNVILKEQKCTVLVLGEPGAGKTTSLERLTLDLARVSLKHFGFGKPIPILIRLNGFYQGTLIEFIVHTLNGSGKSGKVLSKNIADLLSKGRILLLFDALDEALGEQRESTLSGLKELSESKEYKKVKIIITCRTKEDPGEKFKISDSFEIQDLSDDAVSLFIQTYNEASLSESEIKNLLQNHNLLAPKTLGRNPFWLKLIISEKIFEQNKTVILYTAIEKLLNREWEKPSGDREWQRVLPKQEQLLETELGLAWLGYQMSIKNSATVKRERAILILNQWLQGRVGVNQKLRPQDILGLAEDANILVYKSTPIKFRHRILQEMMTALVLRDQLKERKITIESILGLAKDVSWWETIFLLAGLLSNTMCLRLLTMLENDKSDERFVLVALGLLLSTGKFSKRINKVVEKFLSSLDWTLKPLQRQSIRELMIQFSPKMVMLFLKLINDENAILRKKGVWLLCVARDPQATKALVEIALTPLKFDENGFPIINTQSVGLFDTLPSLGEVAVEPLSEIFYTAIKQSDILGRLPFNKQKYILGRSSFNKQKYIDQIRNFVS